MRKLVGALLLGSALVAAPAAAQFSESFTAPNALSGTNWSVNQSGQIVQAPDGGNALNFSRTNSGSDLISREFSLAAGTYVVNVDYLCTSGTVCGGFLGLINAFPSRDGWFATDDQSPSGYPVQFTFANNSNTAFTSNTFRFALTGGNYRFKLEDFNGTAGNIPGDAYFRNLSISVPEPATWAMMIMGFGVVGAGLRRRRATVRTGVRFA